MNIEMYDRFEADLFKQIYKSCTDREWLPAKFPESEDINERWDDISVEFIQDAINEYEGYPVATLAWASYIGAAVAKWWDTAWEQNKLRGYTSLKGKEGFDDLDENVLQNILGYKLESKQAEELNKKFNVCAAEANSFLLHGDVEPGTIDAFYCFVRTLRVMYKIGAAIELTELGYTFKAVTF